MQVAARRASAPPLWAVGTVALTVALAATGFLWTRNSNVTHWQVPYQVVRGGVSYPLFDKSHCYSLSEIAPIRRIGTASGLALFAVPGNDPELFYVQPEGHRCYMRYLSLSNVG